ncbi:type VI secretion system ATPase TssH [Sphingomonas radiodurans]|uniref:type VI secretion system ATPase TssH n=1 Tax=Sphingomonas radiodurans TaxID=2890321 RepID=UPI001E2A901D|nr:type VI secretion system ATPase TssH [Sphingomonas radiodurans]WBH16696.1 type VI secretion system ATPase TssH [Sphingomonas radiodurans]
MAQLNLKSLVAKLDDTCRSTLESAAGLALSRTNYDIEVEHWLLKLIDRQTSDVAVILSHFEVDAGRLAQDINRQVDRFKTGNGRAPAIAPNVAKLIREAWLIGSLELGATKIRSGHLLLALVGSDEMTSVARDASTQFAKIPAETLRTTMTQIASGSEEAKTAEASAPAEAANAGGGGAAPAAARGGENLAKFCIDLTQQARDGKIDPIFGRDPEIRQIVDILTRRRQNNPILTGEAGVGKTAVVEGFALRIVQGDVPEALKNVRLLSLDLGLLQAGAGIKGEFENRLKSVIEEVKASPTPIIMFIDEAHTLIGAGGAEGQNDAANLLKPALARGEMRTIAATTWAEYKKYFEKDPALTRRFQVVKVEEPAEKLAVAMLRGLVPVLEKHHGVTILGEALEAAAGLSHRYIAGRQLPDKAISLLDTACARVGISQAATPPALEDVQRQLGLLASEVRMLEREQRSGIDNAAALQASVERKAELEAEQEALTKRWDEEKRLVQEVSNARLALDGLMNNEAREKAVAVPAEGAPVSDTPAPDGFGQSAAVAEARQKLKEAQAALTIQRGEEIMVYDVVDRDVVASVLAGWTGIPAGRMSGDEIRSVLNVSSQLSARIKGQQYALDVIGQTVRTARAGLADPRKPLGVFLFCGTSGVGKTETALALAELLYGGEQNVTTINMSEFKEEHKVSTLVGAAPGYVGYGEGGVLTEAVRRKPYSVILLDEMEKAHPGVQDVFYQVFDKGMLKDGQGRDIDFKNTLIIMTSNAGTETIEDLCRSAEVLPEPEVLASELRPALLEYFKPAFLGRVVTVPFFPLRPEILREIVVISLNRIRQRVTGNYGATFEWDDALLDRLVARCTEVESGARNIENILKRGLLADLAEELLGLRADGKDVTSVHVTSGDEKDYGFTIA